MKTIEVTQSSWGSYPKIYNLGHAYLADLLFDDVHVEEKIDGSQFSFGVFNSDNGPELRCRSKGAQLNIHAPDKMFSRGVDAVKAIQPQLNIGWTYSGEYLQKPKHNTLSYSRIPCNHVAIFDIRTGPECYLSYSEKKAEAERLGFECVPMVHDGKIEDVQMFRELLDRDSILGGQKIEGVVIKNYKRFGLDGKALMGKFVSELFKEVHAGDWKERHPGSKDVVAVIVSQYRTPARWMKAIQHLAEAGQLENDPRDISKLFPEVHRDIKDECESEIKEVLWKWVWPQIARQCCQGLPEFYKERLLENQFTQNTQGKQTP